MALYLVVHHQQDPQKPFENKWQDDDPLLLTSIQTTLEIGNLCSTAKEQNQWVYIHRCGYNHNEPMICCSVHVKYAEVIGGRIIVQFRDQTRLGIAPRNPPPPAQHQNYYNNDPPAL